MTVSFAALGTTATLAVLDDEALLDARAALDRELALVDDACSRFRADSELVRLNGRAGRRTVVGEYLFDAVKRAVEIAEATAGLVDPTVGRSLRLAGYDATYAIVRDRDGSRFRPRFEIAPGWRYVELDETNRTVRTPVGVELDLGATAKAFAADRAAQAAATATGSGVLVSLGGDIAVAGPVPDGGWPVGIADDHAGSPEETVTIQSGGLATSSVTVRRWSSGEAELHHLIDPRTGRSASSRWRTATVAARTCVDANAAATAAIILDEAAPDWLAARRLPARLVAQSGAVQHVHDWPVAA